MKIYVTADDGTVAIVSDGQGYEITREKNK
jgi:beta-lactamase superfamily II metal-dependent hydrolase